MATLQASMKYLAPLLILFAFSPVFAYAAAAPDVTSYCASTDPITMTGTSGTDYWISFSSGGSQVINDLEEFNDHGYPFTENADGAGVAYTGDAYSDGVGSSYHILVGDLSFSDACVGSDQSYATCAAQGLYTTDYTITKGGDSCGGGGGGGGGGDFGSFGPGNGLTFGSVWAFSAIILTVVVVSVYLAIFFLILWVIAWPLAYFLRAIKKILYG